MTTPTEAKKMLCPLQSATSEQLCAADHCMAWRWVPKVVIYQQNRFVPALKQMLPPEHGYCGMAGVPRTGAPA